jgi:hypothetical protein
MFYYILEISNCKEGPKSLMITSGLPRIPQSCVDRKGVMPGIGTFLRKRLGPG